MLENFEMINAIGEQSIARAGSAARD